MFKINLVVCLFYFLSSPSNKANTSWYVVEEGSLLHSVLFRHLVVDQDVAGAPLDWPGLGRDYRVTTVVEGVKCLPGISSSPSHCRTWPCRGCSVCGWLPASLSPLHSHTRCHSPPPHDLQPVITLYTFLVAKVTQEIAGHGHWICLWVSQSNFSKSYMKSYWCHNDVINT